MCKNVLFLLFHIFKYIQIIHRNDNLKKTTNTR
nr:MAG TPA: hypothetical protein [Caudoviricetes sp.]